MGLDNFTAPSTGTTPAGSPFLRMDQSSAGKYPDLPPSISDTTNFRIKKIMDDAKMLEEEIKFRKSIYKKYGRFSSVTDGIEYTLIMADIVLGTVATAIPGVGSLVSAATFSGVGLISGVAKMIQAKLMAKKMKNYRLAIVATTTLANLNRKISKAISDGQITHEEFEDIQNTVVEWKNGLQVVGKQPTLSRETIELLSQQATEKAQKDLLDQLKNMNLGKM
ncbi:hypothetical protein MIV071L [Invertebrate iridescent virus 3]|uniref:Uncharacterized protein 071L n=1 Tax=Invertebrate iridescent virus 3 TaxID=345201 RepID=VF259_IIV3|nr:hypothetical protein MIV071L [Invertebrate iridescent virus 3]Q196Y9.1 RecName: Full=Uncharacterized protein 071L [Invertebrate iridescent virus 3]ABF82101.1 hypothetical protein MIV071L [Invertebrate iridescent virus 3]